MASELKPQQLQAARILAGGSSHEATARAVKCSKKTIDRWCQIPEFRQLVDSLRTNKFEAAIQSIKEVDSNTAKRLAEKALAAVEAILSDPDSRNCDRLKAAGLIAGWTGLDQGRLVEKTEETPYADHESRERRIDELMRRRALIQQHRAGRQQSGDGAG